MDDFGVGALIKFFCWSIAILALVCIGLTTWLTVMLT